MMQGKSIRLPEPGGLLQRLWEFLSGHRRDLDVLRHELRTPLTGILGMAELLRHSGLRGEQLEILSALEQAGGQLAGLLQRPDDAWEKSKLETQPERVAFNGLHLLENITRAHWVPARHRGLELYLLFDHRLPVCWHGDASLVRQMLDNLLANAIKFTHSGHVLLEARCGRKVGSASRGLILKVTDTGPGIAARDAGAIYELGNRGRDRRKRLRSGPDSGLGFGLFVCRRIATILGGNLSHVATGSGGTSFIVQLPGVLPLVPAWPARFNPRLLVGSSCEVSLPSPVNYVVAHALRRMGMVTRFSKGECNEFGGQTDVRITGAPARCESAGISCAAPQPVLHSNLEPLMLRLALHRRMQTQ